MIYLISIKPHYHVLIGTNSIDGDANSVGIDAFCVVADTILVDDPTQRTPIDTILVDGDANSVGIDAFCTVALPITPNKKASAIRRWP